MVMKQKRKIEIWCVTRWNERYQTWKIFKRAGLFEDDFKAIERADQLEKFTGIKHFAQRLRYMPVKQPRRRPDEL